MSDRIALLEKIEKLNKQLGFVGSRGEQYLTDEMLESLCIELEEEVSKRKKCVRYYGGLGGMCQHCGKSEEEHIKDKRGE